MRMERSYNVLLDDVQHAETNHTVKTEPNCLPVLKENVGTDILFYDILVPFSSYHSRFQ